MQLQVLLFGRLIKVEYTSFLAFHLSSLAAKAVNQDEDVQPSFQAPK